MLACMPDHTNNSIIMHPMRESVARTFLMPFTSDGSIEIFAPLSSCSAFMIDPPIPITVLIALVGQSMDNTALPRSASPTVLALCLFSSAWTLASAFSARGRSTSPSPSIVPSMTIRCLFSASPSGISSSSTDSVAKPFRISFRLRLRAVSGSIAAAPVVISSPSISFASSSFLGFLSSPSPLVSASMSPELWLPPRSSLDLLHPATFFPL
mmetsp:Transcript_5581/g.20315  ORF Transcript_5581/g.20315 Transcript_5581/m.20315 type:complete len:211 (-) Transcript_5581:547-1179(-)